MPKKLISIIMPTYNESLCVEKAADAVADVMASLPQYDYEHIFIDNHSTDGTDLILRRLAIADRRIRVILNSRNFGHLRSPYHALMNCNGDCGIILGADLQEPPEKIVEFVKYWQLGYKAVLGVKENSHDTAPVRLLRWTFYQVLDKISEKPHIKNFMGFALIDRCVLDALRKFNDPAPYYRGLIAEAGYESCTVPYTQRKREQGKSHNNFYSLFDTAMLGFVNNSKVPLRLATLAGSAIACISFLIGIVYLIYKLINWQGFETGLAPVLIGMSFLGGIQLLFLGILGEYIGQIYTQVLHRPLVVEKERINWD